MSTSKEMQTFLRNLYAENEITVKVETGEEDRTDDWVEGTEGGSDGLCDVSLEEDIKEFKPVLKSDIDFMDVKEEPGLSESVDGPDIKCGADLFSVLLEGKKCLNQRNKAKEKDCHLGRNGMKWYKHPVNNSDDASQEETRAPKTPLDCWKLLITDDIISEIVQHTNNKIAQNNKNYKKKSVVKPTDCEEIRALFGLLYLGAALSYHRRKLEEFWESDGTGVEAFRITMSHNRFSALLSNIQFDDSNTREERTKLDKLAEIREILEKFVFNCQVAYRPNNYLFIYDKFEPYRGACTFRHFVTKTNAHCGIRIVKLIDCKNFYTYNMEIDCKKQPEGPYNFSTEPSEVVFRQIAPISGSGRVVAMDYRFASFDLFTKLLREHQLQAVGHTRKSNIPIPPELHSTKSTKKYSSKFAFQENVTLVSYTANGDSRFFLSTYHHDNKISEESGDLIKPEIAHLFDLTKQAIDTAHKIWECHSTSRNCRRWSLALFYSILNVAGVNAQVIYRQNNPDESMSRRKFLKKLGLQLIEDLIQTRKKVPNLPQDLKRRLREHDSNDEASTSREYHPPLKNAKRCGRCSICRKTRDRKTRYRCAACYRYICLQHSTFICGPCTAKHIPTP